MDIGVYKKRVLPRPIVLLLVSLSLGHTLPTILLYQSSLSLSKPLYYMGYNLFRRRGRALGTLI